MSAATVLLAALAIGLFAVSLAAQYRYVLSEKHEVLPSVIEAICLDVGMAVFSLLALGLARAGQSARVERALIVACAAGSALMNYAAANGGSPRSVAAYVVPPIFLAIVVDRVVAVVRRHVLGDSERSAWVVVGTIALYGLRLVVALPSTAAGLRRWVISSTPLPDAGGAAGATPEPATVPPGAETKKARLLRLYRDHPQYGDRAAVGRVAAELAPHADMGANNARKLIGQELRERAS